MKLIIKKVNTRQACNFWLPFLLFGLCVTLQSCKLVASKKPLYCGVPQNTYNSAKAKVRGPIDGGTDENNDGVIDHIEAVTTWDFAQMLSVLHSKKEHQQYQWTNIDTCYLFKMTPSDFYEDKSQPILWQTCRTFSYSVFSSSGEIIGSSANEVGCRNFATQEWILI